MEEQKEIEEKKIKKAFYGPEDTLVMPLKCPDCGTNAWWKGPRGGLSTNIKCGNPGCGSEFNICPPIRFIERI